MSIRVQFESGQDVAAADIRQVFPRLAFAPDTDLAEFGYPFLALTEPPSAPSVHARVIRAPNVQVNGVWTQVWAFDPPNAADWLQAAKTAARAQVDAMEAQKVGRFPWDFGAPFGVLHLQLRGIEDQANWLTLRSTAQSLIAAGMGNEIVLAIRAEEDVTVPVTAVQAEACLATMAAFGGNTKARAWAIKDAINAATTEAGVAAVLDAELDAGWPIDNL